MLLPTLLGAADLAIDHVTAAGTNLAKMRASLAAVGIQSEYGGPHSNHATEMALTSFPDGSYLELIAIQPNADPQAVADHYWSKQLKADAGPTAWAVRAKDLAAEVKRLQSAKVTVSEPARTGRQRPDGVKLDWEAARVGVEPNGTFFPFLIRDFTPRQQRAYPAGKPTTKDFSGVIKVVIAVHDLKTAVTRYREAYGLPEPIQQADAGFNARLALLGGTPVILAAPITSQSWLAQRLEQVGEGPCAFVLGVRNERPYKVASKTRWFGIDTSWLDADKLGWRLAFQSAN
jgi:hypothetical protein